MSESRYTFSRKVKEGRIISVSDTYKINQAVNNGLIPYTTIILEQSQRLDHLAGIAYNDSTLWWIIAAASGIGWGLQCPPGTVIKIPNSAIDAYGEIA
jgi:hypothetical protein